MGCGSSDYYRTQSIRATRLEVSRYFRNTRGLDAYMTFQTEYPYPTPSSQNRLTTPVNTAIMSNAFRKLREVQLNDTLITWYEFRIVAGCMPMLGQVEIGYNRMKTLEIPNNLSAALPQHPSIHILNFDSNEFSSWTEICDGLRPFPACVGPCVIIGKKKWLISVHIRLERLLLSSNRIERIEPMSNSETSPLRNLKHLALSSNALATWADLDGLVHWCPNLESLKLTENPLVQGKDPCTIKDSQHVRLSSRFSHHSTHKPQ